MRADGRSADQLREHYIERGFQPQAYSSVLISTGNTRVICSVSLEEKVPHFLEGRGQGWVTAEYGMLPGATSTRYRREHGGPAARSQEIQRLVGRSLRMMVDLQSLGEHTLRVDCDVLNADGGTRTASITGGAVAVGEAIKRMLREGRLKSSPMIQPVAAVSVGIVADEILLDLDYREDSGADADGNFVMAADKSWIEIQTTGERNPVTDEQFLKMMRLARKGIQELFALWPEAQ